MEKSIAAICGLVEDEKRRILRAFYVEMSERTYHFIYDAPMHRNYLNAKEDIWVSCYCPSQHETNRKDIPSGHQMGSLRSHCDFWTDIPIMENKDLPFGKVVLRNALLPDTEEQDDEHE